MDSLTRRNFLSTVAFFLPSLSLTASTWKSKKSLIVHHVLFWLKNVNSEEDKIKLMENLEALKKIEYHRTLIGIPMEGQEYEGTDSSYNVSLVTYFDDVKGRTAYENHPVHQAFIRDSNYLWQKTVTYTTVCQLP